MGISIIASGHHDLTPTDAAVRQTRRQKMFARLMNQIDRFAMAFVVVLAASPILSIAAQAALV
jgi:hypothetical protein